MLEQAPEVSIVAATCRCRQAGRGLMVLLLVALASFLQHSNPCFTLFPILLSLPLQSSFPLSCWGLRAWLLRLAGADRQAESHRHGALLSLHSPQGQDHGCCG